MSPPTAPPARPVDPGPVPPGPHSGADPGSPREVPVRTLAPFLIITFALAWGILGLFIALPDAMEAAFGALTGRHPLFVLAVWAPAVSALTLIGLTGGRQAVGRYLSRLRLWRAPLRWYAFLLLGIPALFFAGAALGGTPSPSAFPFESVGGAVGAMAFMAILGPVEELGWRGLALPLLQRRLAPLWAGLLLGLVWALWHLPAFYLSGTPQGGWGFMPFFIGAVGASLILTALFNAARGSILIAALFHFQLNNPLWPDAQPYDMYLFAGVAVLVVWLNRGSMLRSGVGASEVVPGAVPRDAP